MLHEIGEVTALANGRLTVRVQKRSGCASCAKPCGVGKLGALSPEHCFDLQFPERADLKVGDRVVVGLPEQALLQATLTIYGLPLFGLLLGAMLASMVGARLAIAGDGLVLAGALLGGGLGWLLARRFGQRLEQQTHVQPQLLGPAP